MSLTKEILAQRKRERERAEDWERAFAVLRRRTQRTRAKILQAILCLIVGLAHLWWAAHLDLIVQGNGRTALADGVYWRLLLGVTLVASGIQRVWVRAEDRLLLRLLEESASADAVKGDLPGGQHAPPV